ncbi:hypothetical protein PAXRUDRAFT_485451 [Paxillus rubicundulus Ve08.2h10]|uniref:Uncharacterized protein n=1 Tax=Paxillus rubicundulus Ve08.2h10 TaxID=930991 RepID=A0A0D0DPM9_9AGAM|nr:hypothetical protein PAXRUDRAFT_485451 [Paxillus rubicundulus Ve08.2h10]
MRVDHGAGTRTVDPGMVARAGWTSCLCKRRPGDFGGIGGLPMTRFVTWNERKCILFVCFP